MTAERPRKAGGAREAAGVALIAAAVWLAWQVVLAPLAERAPPELAIRVAPSSPAVLSRAALSELEADRKDQAAALARDAISRAPFDIRALRVLALTLDPDAEAVRADEVMTLAGNWSLRDSAVHAWLIERRLRQGDYVSAFRHADTLLKRGQAVHEQAYLLMATAAVEDGRGLAALEAFMAEERPWRPEFLVWLQRHPDMDSLLATLVVSLQQTSAPLTDRDLDVVYKIWVDEGRIGAVRMVRERIGRPRADSLLFAGDFQGEGLIAPFNWTLSSGAGRIVEAVPDDLGSGRTALRVEYDSRSSDAIAWQLLLLEPGAYTLSGQRRVEFGEMRMDWRVRCLESGQTVSGEVAGPEAGEGWSDFSTRLTVPAQGCAAQWLELAPRPSDFRRTVGNWFFGLDIRPAAARG